MASRRQGQGQGQDENVLLAPKRGGVRSHTLSSTKKGVNENTLSAPAKHVLGPGAGAGGKTLGSSTSNINSLKKPALGSGLNEKASESKNGQSANGKPPTLAARRAPLASKAGTPLRPVLGTRPSQQLKSTRDISSAPLKTSSKPKLSSHLSGAGGGTPLTSRSRVAHTPATTSKVAKPIKRALNVYTPGPVTKSKLSTQIQPDDEYEVEYMPPPLTERPYEPASMTSLGQSEDEDLFAPESQKPSDLGFKLDFNLDNDMTIQPSESLRLNEIPPEDDFLFDI